MPGDKEIFGNTGAAVTLFASASAGDLGVDDDRLDSRSIVSNEGAVGPNGEPPPDFKKEKGSLNSPSADLRIGAFFGFGSDESVESFAGMGMRITAPQSGQRTFLPADDAFTRIAFPQSHAVLMTPSTMYC
ncbi:hypothetical protein [Rubripirellula tenax]|uniref:hypothetical protein n=1 Tax=Rubripirellula tenax TaxID=2528015 RepID=UPI0011B6E1CC|nr:hypothetical protein [Rubripirellula tenax]